MQAVYTALLTMFAAVAFTCQSSGQQPHENAPASLHREARQQTLTNPNPEPIPAALSWKGTLPNGAHSFPLSGTERWAPPFKVEKRGRVHRHADMEDMELFRFQSGYVPPFGRVEATYSLDALIKYSTDEVGEDLYLIAPIMPIFSGCEDMPDYDSRRQCSDKQMLMFVFNNFQLPTALRDSCLGGSIVLGFVVEKDGKVGRVEVRRGLHPLVDAEAVRVLQSMPVWTPGGYNGRPVAVQYNFPLRIRIFD